MHLTQLTQKQLPLLEEPLSELGLGVRNLNTLEEGGVLSVLDALESCPSSQKQCAERCRCRARLPGLPARWEPRCPLADLPNFGEKALAELREKLAAIGFPMPED